MVGEKCPPKEREERTQMDPDKLSAFTGLKGEVC